VTILLLGADGQLGGYLRSTLAPLGRVVAVTRRGAGSDIACDLTDRSAVRELLLAERPSLVVNAAAYTAVDAAEHDIEAAQAMNATLPGLLGEIGRTLGAGIIHYSTDYVFAGDARHAYREADVTVPVNVYGQTKLEGEQSLAASGADHLILRTAWVYSLHGRNFLTTMLRLARERGELSVVADQHGSPTSALLLARSTAHIVKNWHPGRGRQQGVYHLTASGSTTWHGFAEAIVANAVAVGALSHPVPVKAITTSAFPTPARRPAWSLLDTHRIKADFALALPRWEDNLAEVMAPLPSRA
jgi:dTDP-4-dehydrorhamnose reductase